MSNRMLSMVVAIAALAGLSATTIASAADERFCDEYAHAAVNQFRSAEHHYRCEGFMRREPARWQPDFRAHYDWCRGVSRDAAWDERNARTRALDICVRDERR